MKTNFKLLIFTISFMTVSTLSATENVERGKRNSPNDYLNPEQVEKLSKKCKEPKASCPHKIVCYFNGLWWACPNPYDKRRAEGVEDSYRQGYFIRKRESSLSNEDFQNDKNWNS